MAAAVCMLLYSWCLETGVSATGPGVAVFCGVLKCSMRTEVQYAAMAGFNIIYLSSATIVLNRSRWLGATAA